MLVWTTAGDARLVAWQAARDVGFKVTYGDGSRPSVVKAFAHDVDPRAFVVVYTARRRAVAAVENLRAAFPDTPIYARALDLRCRPGAPPALERRGILDAAAATGCRLQRPRKAADRTIRRHCRAGQRACSCCRCCRHPECPDRACLALHQVSSGAAAVAWADRRLASRGEPRLCRHAAELSAGGATHITTANTEAGTALGSALLKDLGVAREGQLQPLVKALRRQMDARCASPARPLRPEIAQLPPLAPPFLSTATCLCVWQERIQALPVVWSLDRDSHPEPLFL